MREIKFRVWDKDCKRMHVCGDNTHDTIYFFEDNCACYYNLQNGEGSSPDGTGTYKLMQYTGLCDKNGVEIYEGDVLLWGDDNRQNQVVFSQGSFQMQRYGGLAPLRYHNLINSEAMNAEVIGNIYENPDLIEGGAE